MSRSCPWSRRLVETLAKSVAYLMAGLVLADLACSLRAPASDADAGARSPIDAGMANAATPADEAPPGTYLEARRARLTTLDDEPGLAKNADAIRAHFGGTLPTDMELQAVPLGSGKQALLLGSADDDPKPIALLVDVSGAAIWTKERPFAGITPPAKPFAITPRPDNGVALFLYDAPTRLVAARMWTPEGAPFADLVLFELARCDAISASWWPGRGWIVVASFPGGARAQLVTEGGQPAWDPQGIAVGEAWRAAAPATLAIDPATSSWLLVQHATRSGGDHVVAIRYGVNGDRLEKSAADLGPVAHVTRLSDRIDVALARPGVARIDVAGKGVEVRIASGR